MEIGQAAIVFVFLSGLFAGSLHVLSGPDHVAAIAPLTARSPRAGSTFGAVWGLGHGGGVLLWLLLSSWYRRAFGLELEPAALEAAVGCSLITLGTFSYFQQPHEHAPHGGTAAHGGRAAAFALGALHGSAGASHLFALVPTLGLPTGAAITYGAGYLFAGVLAMGTVGTVLGRIGASLTDLNAFRRICALLVVALGAVWLVGALSEL